MYPKYVQIEFRKENDHFFLMAKENNYVVFQASGSISASKMSWEAMTVSLSAYYDKMP